MKTRVGPWGAVPIALLTDDTITPNMLKVYVVLSAYQGTNGKCWPSREEISASTGIGVSGVSQAITALVKSGWIERERRSQQHKTNVYHVLFDIPNVRETPTSGKPGYPGNSDVGCPENPHIPLYNNKTNIQDQDAAKPVKKDWSPLKDELAESYRNAFTSQTPADAWKSQLQERRHLVDIAKRTRSLSTLTEIPEDELAQRILATYADRKKYSKADYWRNAPFVPSALTSRWDAVVEVLKQEVEREKTMEAPSEAEYATPF